MSICSAENCPLRAGGTRVTEIPENDPDRTTAACIAAINITQVNFKSIESAGIIGHELGTLRSDALGVEQALKEAIQIAARQINSKRLLIKSESMGNGGSS